MEKTKLFVKYKFIDLSKDDKYVLHFFQTIYAFDIDTGFPRYCGGYLPEKFGNWQYKSSLAKTVFSFLFLGSLASWSANSQNREYRDFKKRVPEYILHFRPGSEKNKTGFRPVS